MTFESKEDLIETFCDAKKPLDDESVEVLDEVIEEIGSDAGWIVAALICMVCTNEELAIFTNILDVDDLECTACDRRSLIVKEEPEWL